MLAKKLTSEVEHVAEPATVPSEAELLQQLVYAPANAIEVGKSLPEIQRARIAQFCYNKVHMRELGLRLASTCDLMSLKAAFGRGGEVVYKQSRDVEKTMGALKNTPGNQAPKPISLQGSITGFDD